MSMALLETHLKDANFLYHQWGTGVLITVLGPCCTYQDVWCTPENKGVMVQSLIPCDAGVSIEDATKLCQVLDAYFQRKVNCVHNPQEKSFEVTTWLPMDDFTSQLRLFIEMCTNVELFLRSITAETLDDAHLISFYFSFRNDLHFA